MKKTSWVAILFACILMVTCSITAEAKDKKSIERGMTKQEVTAVLGKPLTTSFDENGETWEFVKSQGGLLNYHEVLLIVDFDHNGRVVRYEQKILPTADNSGSVQTPMIPPFDNRRVGYDPMSPYYNEWAVLTDSEFNRLCTKINAASFNSNKLDLIEVASMRCYYTCTSVCACWACSLFPMSVCRR